MIGPFSSCAPANHIAASWRIHQLAQTAARPSSSSARPLKNPPLISYARVTSTPDRLVEPTERIATDTVSSGSSVLMLAPPRPADWVIHQSSAVGAPGR